MATFKVIHKANKKLKLQYVSGTYHLKPDQFETGATVIDDADKETVQTVLNTILQSGESVVQYYEEEESNHA